MNSSRGGVFQITLSRSHFEYSKGEVDSEYYNEDGLRALH